LTAAFSSLSRSLRPSEAQLLLIVEPFSVFMYNFEFSGVCNAFLNHWFSRLHYFHPDVFFEADDEQLVFEELF
jgi:hypothetical protein